MPKEQDLYFNTAATGLVPPSYIETQATFLQKLTTNASDANEGWYAQSLNNLRHQVALFLDAGDDEIAFVPNFSYALSALIQAFPRETRVMTLYEDYPSISDPFRVNGFPTKRLKGKKSIHFSTDELYLALLEDKIEVLAISHVQWLTGYRIDLEELCAFCRKNGILTIIDVTQSMGALPVSLEISGADVIIGSNYKWMNAGLGTGILCVRRSFLERFPARIRGNHSRMLAGPKWEDNASILGYEPGHLNTPGLILLECAVTDKMHTGTGRIAAHNLSLTKRFMESIIHPEIIVGPSSMKHRSSIVSLRGGEALYNHLRRQGFVISYRNKFVRVSFHHHNTEDGTDALAHAVNQFKQT